MQPQVVIIGAPHSGKQYLAHTLSSNFDTCAFNVLSTCGETPALLTEVYDACHTILCIVTLSVLQEMKHQTVATAHVTKMRISYLLSIKVPVIFVVTCVDVPVFERISHISTYRDYIHAQYPKCKFFTISIRPPHVHIDHLLQHVADHIYQRIEYMINLENMLLGVTYPPTVHVERYWLADGN
jgi:hypothetical protein